MQCDRGIGRFGFASWRKTGPQRKTAFVISRVLAEVRPRVLGLGSARLRQDLSPGRLNVYALFAKAQIPKLHPWGDLLEGVCHKASSFRRRNSTWDSMTPRSRPSLPQSPPCSPRSGNDTAARSASFSSLPLSEPHDLEILSIHLSQAACPVLLVTIVTKE